MTKKLLFLGFLFTIFFSNAQDKKWSLEASYPLWVGDNFGNDADGILDIGIKYRVLDFNIVELGASMNTALFHENIRSFDIPQSDDFDETDWIFQPRIFGEFQIPGIKKLRPNLGLGYTIVSSNFEGMLNGQDFSNKNSYGGFNINLGISYDVWNNFFIQAQYDYISLDVEFRDNLDLGIFKAGIGYRF
ncbi:outer membrane protein [Maribacter sp. 2210JD10-5]|uniref:outer membrane protein n=1 Tax=Maribacter sp. 2210JD10-5 TaxID=3386272 RepID=UPI0039BD1F18